MLILFYCTSLVLRDQTPRYIILEPYLSPQEILTRFRTRISYPWPLYYVHTDLTLKTTYVQTNTLQPLDH